MVREERPPKLLERRKGKDYKGTGKGPSNDGGKSKGGKDDSKKPWEKKKD